MHQKKRDFNIKNRLKITKGIQPYHKVIMQSICKDKLLNVILLK